MKYNAGGTAEEKKPSLTIYADMDISHNKVNSWDICSTVVFAGC
jgi:hypothetical protein